MKFVYSEWDDELYRKLKSLADLMAIFNYLLIRFNGDVEETLRMMERLQQQGYIDANYDLDEFRRQLEKARVIKNTGKGFQLGAKGEKQLRQDAFEQIFQRMKATGKGQHALPYEGGTSEELLPEKREFSFGDNFRSIDYGSSLFNSIKRSGDFGLNMEEEDLEVFEAERSTSCATVLMIDISHSMILYGEDRITPAKQVAMAFTELVLTKYPKDDLSIVLFGDTAQQVLLIQRIGPDVLAVAQRGIKNPPFAFGICPGDGIIAAGFHVHLFEFFLIGFFRIHADQYLDVIPRILVELIDLVLNSPALGKH